MSGKSSFKYRVAQYILILCISLGLAFANAGESHIVADPTAPGRNQPQVIGTGNGLPQVNISTPNSNGLSYNRYQQFDVGQQGAILNNSTRNVQTQLGGWIERNPNLAGGSANLIVNEVNSSRPSQIGGFIEIAGQRADVVLANPSGISVDGGGFINANRATLTTGTPIIQNGSLTGFEVRGGQIDILGDGLNNRNATFTDIIAHSVNVNAKLHAAQQLNIVAGENFVSRDASQITRLNPDAETGVSIDVKALGGMYANQIRLIGTGRGVGVNSIQNEGEITAGVGEVYIAADGKLMNSSVISGRGGVGIDIEDDVANRGSIYSGADLSIDALGNIVNDGVVESAENFAIRSEEKTVYNQSDASMLSGGDMAVNAGDDLSNDGAITAGGTLTVRVDDAVRNTGEILADGIGIASDSLHNTGLIDATDVLITADELYNVDTGSIFGDHIAIEAGRFVNGASTYTGHMPITHTEYDPVTNLYTYRDDAMTDYGDDSANFDYENAVADREEEFDFGAPDEEDPESPYDPEDDAYGETEIGAGESNDFTYEPEEGRKTTTGNSGMISARDRLDIGFSDLLFNQDDGLLLSGGGMHIGGALDADNHAAGTGGRLNNHSATIDAGGDLFMNVAELENLNAHYTTEERLIFEGWYTGYRFHGNDKVFIAGIDQIVMGETGRGAWKIVLPYNAEDFYQYSILRKIYDQFILESRPAYITSGGDMTITGNVTNNRSIMTAGGMLSITGNPTNIEAQESMVTRDTGSIQWTWVDWNSLGTRHKRKYSYAGAYRPAPVHDFTQRDVALFGDPDIAQPNGNPTGNILDAIANSGVFSPDGLNGNLWGVNNSPDAGYIIESNPRFSDYRTWLSSDFMVERLSADPQNALKRLGDGYYEQRLIRDQIANMTGARYLSGFASDEEQYRALMVAGVDFAEEYELSLGMKLTAEQMAQLTSDIVWLEYVTVDTPDGPVQALAPVVYLAPGREVLLTAGGGIVSGREVAITGELRNAGSILGTDSVSISGTDISNSGTVAGGFVSMAALRDINNKGGSIIGQTGVELAAGRDINIESATYTTSTQNGNQSSSRTEIAGQAGVFVTDEEGSLSMKAGNDITLAAADVESEGSMSIAAGNDLNIGGVAVSFEHETGVKGDNYLHDRESMDVGSTLYAAKDMELSAGKNVSVTGSSVLGDAAIDVKAGGDVSVTESRAQEFHETTSLAESSGFLSKKTEKTHELMDDDSAIGSEISGNTVNITSGGDFSLRGSTVAASEGLNVTATGDIDISGAENSSDYAYAEEMKKTGFSASFSGTGVGISYGTTKTSDQSSDREHTITGSLVGSETGDVTLYAGKDVGISGSQVVAGTGDVAISGENVTIDSQYENYDHNERHTFEQKGISLSLGLTGPVASAVEAGMQAADTLGRAQNAGTGRAQALYGIAAARQAYDAGKAVGKIAGKPGSATDIGLSVNLGFSSTKNESSYQSSDQIAVGSQITSGGDTTIVARGEEGNKGTGDLNIIGSTVDAGGDVLLAANNDINLKSAEEASNYTDSNKGSSSGIGVSVGIGMGGIGNIGVNANASKSAGNGSGSTVGHAETVIRGDSVEFASVNDTTIKGAQIIGEEVIGTVGGDLNIISEQNTESHDRKQSSSGGGLSVGMGIGGGLANIGGNYNTQKQEGESDYASVDEQSGIFAGEGGFDITVGGNTHLEGAVIASEAEPEENLLVTGSLTTEDIENSSSYESATKGFGGEFSYEKNGGLGSETANKGSLSPSLPMNDEDSDSSSTKSAISEGFVVITDEEAQLSQTGQTAEEAVADLNRDTESAHEGALDRSPDLQAIFDKQAELADAAGLAGKAVAESVGDISQSMYEKTGDDGWREGGVYKTLLQGAGAALVAQLGNGEGLNAALGAMASQLAAGKIQEVAASLAASMADNPAAQTLLTNLLTNALSGAIGAAAGGETGSASASYMDRNNRQLHILEIEQIQNNAWEFLLEYNSNKEPGYPEMTLDEAIAFLTQEALRQLDFNWSNLLVVQNPEAPEYLYMKSLADDFYKKSILYGNQLFDLSKATDYYDSSINVDINSEFIRNLELTADHYSRYVDSGITNPNAEQRGTSAIWYENAASEIEQRKTQANDMAKALLSLAPGIGDIADALDIIVRIQSGEDVPTLDYALTAVGVIPGAGDAIKAILKAGGTAKDIANAVDVAENVAKIAENAGDVASSARRASNVADSVGSAVNVDKIDEISSLLNKTGTSNGITIRGKTIVPDPKSGNAAIFSGVTDDDVFDYFKDLTGVTELPSARQIGDKGFIYVVETARGNVTLRSFANSAQETGAKWTIDIPKSYIGSGRNAELKFITE